MAVIEQELLDGQRSFPEAQALLAGLAARRLPDRVDVGWHGTASDPLKGSFAVVRRGGPYGELIGETLKLTANGREVFAYVVGARFVPTDISLARRAFMGLGLLTAESIRCTVEVVG